MGGRSGAGGVCGAIPDNAVAGRNLPDAVVVAIQQQMKVQHCIEHG